MKPDIWDVRVASRPERLIGARFTDDHVILRDGSVFDIGSSFVIGAVGEFSGIIKHIASDQNQLGPCPHPYGLHSEAKVQRVLKAYGNKKEYFQFLYVHKPMEVPCGEPAHWDVEEVFA